MATQTVRRLVARVECVRETVNNAPGVRIGARFNRPDVVARYFAFLDTRDREEFWVALLSAKHTLTGVNQVSVGTLTTSVVHPREVYKLAILSNAAAIICVHNHPSGDSEPSREDIEITKRLIAAGKLLGIPLLDHVIVGATDRYVSLRERISEFA